MRKILIVGAGQAGLQLALGLQSHGYAVTVVSNRTPDEIRGGRVTSTQAMFDRALRTERELGLHFWEAQAPRMDALGVALADLAGAEGDGRARPAASWTGRLAAPAYSVDQRVKMAGWMETFAHRGGQLVIHGASLSDLDYFAGRYDLVLVAAGKGELVAMFDRDPARSPYTAPQRALAVSYVHGLEPWAGPGPADDGAEAVRCTIVPGVGELITMPALTTSGRCDILFWEGVPGGPVDVFAGVRDPVEHLSLTLELMERYVPWEYSRALQVELTDAGGTLAGRYTPVVRRPVARLPGGGAALGVGDVVVANDPVTGQGSNWAARCAALYLAAVLDRGELPFDEEWMRGVFDRFWAGARHATRWTNTMLAPPAPHVLELLAAASRHQEVADRLAAGFDDPAGFDPWFYDPDAARDYLAEVERRAGAQPRHDGARGQHPVAAE